MCLYLYPVMRKTQNKPQTLITATSRWKKNVVSYGVVLISSSSTSQISLKRENSVPFSTSHFIMHMSLITTRPGNRACPGQRHPHHYHRGKKPKNLHTLAMEATLFYPHVWNPAYFEQSKQAGMGIWDIISFKLESTDIKEMWFNE